MIIVVIFSLADVMDAVMFVLTAPAASGPAASVQPDAGVFPASSGDTAGVEAETVAAAAH